MLAQHIYNLVTSTLALSGLLVVGTLIGCSSSGQTAANPTAGSYSPYQANYQPPPQYPPYGTYPAPNAQWNQAGFTNVGNAGQVQSFNSNGFAGQTC